MKKIYTLTMVLVLALSLSGCSFGQKKTQGQTGQTGVTPSGGEMVSPQGKSTNSYTFKALKAAIALGIPLKCSYKINNVDYEGYVKGKQWRGKIKFGNAGKMGEVIMKDNCLYSWEEGTTQGMKTCFDKDIWDTNQQQETPDVEYLCAPALIDDSKFALPTNINFVDLKQLEQQGTGN
jgi:hypothetical protein